MLPPDRSRDCSKRGLATISQSRWMSASFSVFSNRRFQPRPRPRLTQVTHMQKEIIKASRILIVDDQVANVLLLRRTLESAGYVNIGSVTDSRETLKSFSFSRESVTGPIFT